MCWSSKTLPVRKIAKSNIKVYKILYKVGGIIKSPFFKEFSWEIGVDFSIPSNCLFVEESPRMYFINEGFHSLKNIPIIVENSYWINSKTRLILFTTDRADTLFECIIPKGSIYYINSNGEVVSDHLRIVKEYKKKVFKWKELFKYLKRLCPTNLLK